MAKKKKKSTKKQPSQGGKGLGFVLLAVLLAALGYGGWWLFHQRYPVWGIDVSHHQGAINWQQLKGAGVQFAFIKATEGKVFVDEDFDENWQASEEAGILHGAYHFFRPSVDGKQQALHFLANYHPHKGDLPPVLDIEETDGQSAAEIRKQAKAWLKTVEQSIGEKPIVYTLPHFANNFLDGEVAQYKLWVVDLGWFWPAKSKGWDAWTFWQYKHTGRLPGISGDVDMNYFNGNKVDLMRLCLP